MSEWERYWRKVREGPGCWWWEGRVGGGYGQHAVCGVRVVAHRVAYELLVGAVTSDLHIHHVCRNPLCCNPAHMEVMTPGEHARLHAASRYAVCCNRGHVWLKDTTRIRTSGSRQCRVCRSINRKRKRRARRKRNRAEVEVVLARLV